MTASAAALIHSTLCGAAREAAFQPYGQIAFADIQQQGCDTGGPAGGAQDVGGPDIAASRRAHVAPRGQLHQQISKWDIAQQIRDQETQSRDHRFASGNSASLVYTEPAGLRRLW